jgi:hypothetical protein
MNFVCIFRPFLRSYIHKSLNLHKTRPTLLYPTLPGDFPGDRNRRHAEDRKRNLQEPRPGLPLAMGVGTGSPIIMGTHGEFWRKHETTQATV